MPFFHRRDSSLEASCYNPNVLGVAIYGAMVMRDIYTRMAQRCLETLPTLTDKKTAR